MPDEVLTSFQQQAALGSLGIGQVVKVNTEQSIELKYLLEQIDLAAGIIAKTD